MALTNEERRQIIRLRKEGVSVSSIAAQFGLNITTVKRLFRKYLLHGNAIFYDESRKRQYSNEMKLKIIREYYEGSSKISLCIKYLISEGLLTEWIKLYDNLGYNGFITKKRSRPSMNDEQDLSRPLADEERKELLSLRSKLKQLEMENEFLKKLDALVQKRLKEEKEK